MVVNWIWGIRSLLCKLQGHSVVCGEGCLFLFCIFTLKYMIFFIRVKICQMAISDCLEIMSFWNLLKHKCQKKITAEFVWPFLFYSLMLTFSCLLMYAFCAGVTGKKKKKRLKKMLQLLTTFACLQSAALYVYIWFSIKIKPA